MEKKCVHRNKLPRQDNNVKADNGNVSSDNRPRSGKVRRIKLFVTPTTGGCFEVCVSPQESVNGLRQTLSRKFKVSSGRINLLYKDRVLKDGNLQDNEITDGSRIVLCPNMESGTASHRAEHSVIQALQNLSDSQVSDFLSGKAPLTLAIRLGEHLMFVQLQLSTVPARPPPPAPLTPPSSPAPPRSTTPTTTSTNVPATTTPASAGPSAGVSRSAFVPTISPVSLVQASHNLTEKLKELTQRSQERLQTRGQVPSQSAPSMPLTPPPSPPPSPGAVIDSMHHLGKGVYSGTFSGTLDPRLQDTSGRPRCDVNTILHILHDLLVAQPSGHMTRSPHPHPDSQNPPPRRFFPDDDNTEEVAMRSKVQRIQMMLEERRKRRSSRRNSQRPYPSPKHLAHCGTLIQPHSPDSVCACPRPPTPVTPNNTAGNTATTAANNNNHTENVETTNYRKPNMEQETVAV